MYKLQNRTGIVRISLAAFGTDPDKNESVTCIRSNGEPPLHGSVETRGAMWAEPIDIKVGSHSIAYPRHLAESVAQVQLPQMGAAHPVHEESKASGDLG
jgi:hypothetical protein